ncbi:hypothetical protein DRE_01245 [Drechslerella stenobrocha 248]|uniref:Uncharacterized protein n=1 Tax=Drechslerella stenobrocha 248 TaxID=1043628 RepID=W7HVF9_9PEZI|nr:hypothetical protein DRE_01245 [Drechslerella stenobrocha 248]
MDYNLVEKDILLFAEGDSNSGFRTKNDPGTTFRSELVDRGDTLMTQARIKYIANGTLVPNKDLATLLVFEFEFINHSPDQSRRFKSAEIALRFENTEPEVPGLALEVYKIAPANVNTILKTKRVREVSHKVGAGIEIGGIPVVSPEVSYEYGVSEEKISEHSIRVSGSMYMMAPHNNRRNTVRWSLSENTHMKGGIPSLIRTVVLLRRPPGAIIRTNIRIDTEVDLFTNARRFFGRERLDDVDPVDIDPDLAYPEDLNENSMEASNLGTLDLFKYAFVVKEGTVESNKFSAIQPEKL